MSNCKIYLGDLVSSNKDAMLIICILFFIRRFPQWISKAKCLCDHCINPMTMEEQVDGAISEPLTATITVLKKHFIDESFRKCTKETCHEEIEEVPIGCHCTMPKS